MQVVMLGPVWDRATLLVDAAQLVGHPVAGRQLVDWVQLGLVPAPSKHGLGRGRGTVARYSEFARRQWLAQLGNRRRGLDVAAMCNLPVGYWVVTAPASPVDDAQAHRALRTWATRRLHRRSGHLSRSAALTIARIGHPGARPSDRRRLLTLLQEAPADPERRVGEPVRAVVAPGEAGRAGHRRELAKHVSLEVAAQLLGAHRLAGGSMDPILARDLATARGLTRQVMVGQQWDSDRAHEIAQAFWNPGAPLGLARVGVACLDVAEALGFLRLRELGVVQG